MRYWFDTEFNEAEGGARITAISVGLVCEDGREYYGISSEFDADSCNPWVQENVLPVLSADGVIDVTPKPLLAIGRDILTFVDRHSEPPEFWGFYQAYDWVVFAQFFGGMLKIPKSWPKYSNDLKQYVEASRSKLGRGFKMLSQGEYVKHNALEDARWTRAAHAHLKSNLRQASRSREP